MLVVCSQSENAAVHIHMQKRREVAVIEKGHERGRGD